MKIVRSNLYLILRFLTWIFLAMVFESHQYTSISMFVRSDSSSRSLIFTARSLPASKFQEDEKNAK